MFYRKLLKDVSVLAPHSCVTVSCPQDAPVKLCDFGFAKIDQGDLMTPQFTPYYVAPQVKGRHRAHKTCACLGGLGTLTALIIEFMLSWFICCETLSVQVLEAQRRHQKEKSGIIPTSPTPYTYNKVKHLLNQALILTLGAASHIPQILLSVVF